MNRMWRGRQLCLVVLVTLLLMGLEQPKLKAQPGGDAAIARPASVAVASSEMVSVPVGEFQM